MSIQYRCPGTISYGRGLTERTVHAGCCAAFVLMSPERRAKVGLRYSVPDPIIAIGEEEPISVGELIEVVRLMQLAADEGVPAPVSHHQVVLVEADYPQPELDALISLGEPHGLTVDLRRQPA
jgi:hypothetical protein